MSLVETLKGTFTAEERIVYRCDECGATFRADPAVDDPRCSKCDSAKVRRINRV
jgi:DNA-directed RNA polymerase subunit RPC12/RpoP